MTHRSRCPCGARPAGRAPSRLGISTLWLSLIVLLPLAAVVVRSTDGGFDTFWNAVSSRQAVAALRFTLLVSLAATADQRRSAAR